MDLVHDKDQLLRELALSAEEKLTDAGRENANRAFNISCTAGLIPVLLVIGLSLIITRGSWIAAIIVSILMLMGLFAFANLAAFISRSQAYKRSYETEIRPEIEASLNAMDIDWYHFELIAYQSTFEESPLREFLVYKGPSDNEDNNHQGVENG